MTHRHSEIVVEPTSERLGAGLRELWGFRDLLILMVQRDISARYRQSVIGVGWVLFRPLMMMLIFSFVFGRVARISSDGLPYAVFVLSGLLPWMYFANVTSAATSSVVGNSNLIQKVYFPRSILPTVGLITGFLELGIQAVVLGLLMAYYDVPFGWTALLAPVFGLLAGLNGLAVGFWLAALNVRYRDVGQAVPFMIQALMWLSPVVYPVSAMPESLRFVYALNPMVGLIDGFRWSLFGTTPDWTAVGLSLAVGAGMLLLGVAYFRRTEVAFADVI